MKTILKNSVLLILACFTLVFAGCKEKEKTYSGHGMSITMTKGFYEQQNINFTYYLVDDDSFMVANKESFDSFGLNSLDSSTTLVEYTDIVIDGNNLFATYNTRENEDYLYFTYEREVEGDEFFYLATTHKTSDAFWLIQFCCFEDEKDEFEDKFLKWADTITFDVDE